MATEFDQITARDIALNIDYDNGRFINAGNPDNGIPFSALIPVYEIFRLTFKIEGDRIMPVEADADPLATTIYLPKSAIAPEVVKDQQYIDRINQQAAVEGLNFRFTDQKTRSWAKEESYPQYEVLGDTWDLHWKEGKLVHESGKTFNFMQTDHDPNERDLVLPYDKATKSIITLDLEKATEIPESVVFMKFDNLALVKTLIGAGAMKTSGITLLTDFKIPASRTAYERSVPYMIVRQIAENYQKSQLRIFPGGREIRIDARKKTLFDVKSGEKYKSSFIRKKGEYYHGFIEKFSGKLEEPWYATTQPYRFDAFSFPAILLQPDCPRDLEFFKKINLENYSSQRNCFVIDQDIQDGLEGIFVKSFNVLGTELIADGAGLSIFQKNNPEKKWDLTGMPLEDGKYNLFVNKQTMELINPNLLDKVDKKNVVLVTLASFDVTDPIGYRKKNDPREFRSLARNAFPPVNPVVGVTPLPLVNPRIIKQIREKHNIHFRQSDKNQTTKKARASKSKRKVI
jgi:hypothetical protein